MMTEIEMLRLQYNEVVNKYNKIRYHNMSAEDKAIRSQKMKEYRQSMPGGYNTYINNYMKEYRSRLTPEMRQKQKEKQREYYIKRKLQTLD